MFVRGRSDSSFGVDSWIGSFANLFYRVRVVSARYWLRPLVSSSTAGSLNLVFVPGIFEGDSLEEVLAQNRCSEAALSQGVGFRPDAQALHRLDWFRVGGTESESLVGTAVAAAQAYPAPTAVTPLARLYVQLTLEFEGARMVVPPAEGSAPAPAPSSVEVFSTPAVGRKASQARK